MASSFSTVGLIGRRGTADIRDSLESVLDVLLNADVEVVVEDDTAAMLVGGDRKDADGAAFARAPRLALGKRTDLIVVVGGDGSLLGVGRDLAHARVPVVGVNRGGLGFLADISPDQIDVSLAEVLNGAYRKEDHFLLEATVCREGREVVTSPALNDVVVHLGGGARMMEFALWVDDEFVYDQRSDGLIISSPTGSTAYALSAGGPIMHPSLDAIVVVPMFPHTLTSRPLVVRGQSRIKVVISESEAEPHASCDSQVDLTLRPGDEVLVSKYATPLTLVYPLDHSFYGSCRSKLDWASRLGGARD
ncbi:MAG: NAD(+) kinase [Pseudomonadales bacterium]|jgi:NAD+ kinase